MIEKPKMRPRIFVNAPSSFNVLSAIVFLLIGIHILAHDSSHLENHEERVIISRPTHEEDMQWKTRSHDETSYR